MEPNDQPQQDPSLEERLRKLESALNVGPVRLSSSEGLFLDGRDSAPDASLPVPLQTPPAPPQGIILQPPELREVVPKRWLLIQLWSEFRLMMQMYFDPRYRLSRTAQFSGPVAIVLFLTFYFLFPIVLPIPFVSPILERLVCVLIGVLYYKVMARELVRYREVLDYLEKYGFR